MKTHEDRFAQFKQEFNDLKEALEAKGKEVADTEALVHSAATAISDQKNVVDFTVEAGERAMTVVSGDIGLDDNDLYVLDDIDRIGLEALDAIHSLFYRHM